MSELDTKKRLLDTAETLFAERGFSATSLRAITRTARTNLAAVHYHFGSKEGLLQAVIHRRIEPINRQRLRRLDQLEAAFPGAPPTVEAVLHAFLEPALRGDGREGARRIVGRLYGEPRRLVEPILVREFGEVTQRFVRALARALPDQTLDDLTWRFHFTVGAMVHVIAGNADGARAVPALTPATGSDTLARLVRYAAAGLRQGTPARVDLTPAASDAPLAEAR